METLEFIALGY